ncbi:helix-turn-helix domain-containing protein [Streptococcus constellatus]|uniref:helix-turn-helix domain-containing protein n=1 Tax=Streptococcus constellatus TaxID=76860 RepID=UPI00123A6637|nr:helix-turn-helix domain-containing protein [Streptococcus constellatus]
MLDKYLEESILNKATILQIILEFQTIDIEQLAQLTEFSEKIIYQHLAELKEEFNDLFYLKVFANTVHLDLITKINPSICFHRIYQSSTFLHLLRYFLQEEKESFICFIQKEYISRATGYRIRDKCLDFLKEVGLSLDRYQVIGPEYRIRFLYHVTIQLRELIYANMAPISLYIFASNNADVTTLKNAFSRNIPPSITRIVVIDFLNSSLHLQDHEETNIIVADQHISTYIKSLFPDKEHILINFSMNFYDIHYQHIYEAIYKLRKERYQEYINGLKKLL